MRKFILSALIFVIFTAGVIFAQNIENEENLDPGRDPFVPLVDEKGEMRKYFRKPESENMTLRAVLMGVSRINNENYALIDGELVKSGDNFKEFLVANIESDRVILKYGEKIFEMKWEADKNETK